MENNRFKGVGVALVTPFLPSGEVDYESLRRLVENVIAKGVNYVVTLCTTSETPTLTDEEKREVLHTVVETTRSRVPVVMGLGGPSTRDIIRQFSVFDFSGVDAILSVTPYYNRPSQEGLFQHYKAIAEASPVPVILYNVKSRTACNIEAETTLRIARECPNVMAIKEASGNINQIMQVVKHAPKDFLVISGDDAITLPLLAAGVDGLISVVANAFPDKVSQMVSLGLAGRFVEARSLHLELLDFTQSCFKEGNPSGIKAALALQGKISPTLRLPLVPVSEKLQNAMREILQKIQ